MSAARIIVLFNLKSGKAESDYENWARKTDLPIVNGLKSVEKFEVFEATGLLGSTGKPPYAYVEIIDVADWAGFEKDVATDTMRRVAGEFQAWADPIFILTRNIETPK